MLIFERTREVKMKCRYCGAEDNLSHAEGCPETFEGADKVLAVRLFEQGKTEGKFCSEPGVNDPSYCLAFTMSRSADQQAVYNTI